MEHLPEKKAKHRPSLVLVAAIAVIGFGQTLKAQLRAGFDTTECVSALQLGAWQSISLDSIGKIKSSFRLIKRSRVVGMYNRGDVWKSDDGTVWINLRGTVSEPLSWVENFYSAMVPGIGSMTLTDGVRVEYDFSDHPRAGVHVGWALGALSLSRELESCLDSLYQNGHKDWIVSGHSQGGGLAHLMSASILRKVQAGKWNGLKIKTYATAAPKPGNLYFTYSYEHLSGRDWCFTLVNAADWVPETPFSIQTLEDFNPTNPFKGAREELKKQPWPKDMVLIGMYGKLVGRLEKASGTFEEYLGDKVFEMAVEPAYPLAVAPEFAHTMNYTRCGTQIVLYPDASYYERFPLEQKNVFAHHLFDAYTWFFNERN